MTQDDVGVIEHALHLQGAVRAAAHVVALKTQTKIQKIKSVKYVAYLNPTYYTFCSTIFKKINN